MKPNETKRYFVVHLKCFPMGSLCEMREMRVGPTILVGSRTRLWLHVITWKWMYKEMIHSGWSGNLSLTLQSSCQMSILHHSFIHFINVCGQSKSSALAGPKRVSLHPNILCNPPSICTLTSLNLTSQDTLQRRSPYNILGSWTIRELRWPSSVVNWVSTYWPTVIIIVGVIIIVVVSRTRLWLHVIT